MPATASINGLAMTSATSSANASASSTSPSNGDGFADALHQAANKPSETKGNSNAEDGAASSRPTARVDDGGGGDRRGAAGDDTTAAASDDGIPTVGSAAGDEPAANVDPLAGSVVPPWLPLVDANVRSDNACPTAAEAAVGDDIANGSTTEGDAPLPAMLLQAMRQGPSPRAEQVSVPPAADKPADPSLPPPGQQDLRDLKAKGPEAAAVTTTATTATAFEQALAQAAPGQTASTASAALMPDPTLAAAARQDIGGELGRVAAPPPAHLTAARGGEPAAASVPVPVSHPQWSDAFASRIAVQVRDGVQHVSLALNPAELGPVEVRLSVNDGQVTAHFHAAHASVRQAIEEAMPRLRDMLTQSGLNLADANVSQQAPQRDARGTPVAGSRSGDGDESPVDGATAVTTAPARSLGLVDAYV